MDYTANIFTSKINWFVSQNELNERNLLGGLINKRDIYYQNKFVKNIQKHNHKTQGYLMTKYKNDKICAKDETIKKKKL